MSTIYHNNIFIIREAGVVLHLLLSLLVVRIKLPGLIMN